MKQLLTIPFILIICFCYGQRDVRYQNKLKEMKFKIITADQTPALCGNVLVGYEGCINRKTHRVVGVQWMEFNDGALPGLYYITVPTKWELRRHEREKERLFKEYGMKELNREEFQQMLSDTTGKYILIY